MNVSAQDITQLLIAYGNGDQNALNKLLPAIYDELHQLASIYMRCQPRNRTLNTTELVHEAYLKLVDQKEAHWQNRAHFFGVAAKAMRQILVDYARQKKAAKRGGGNPKISLNDITVIAAERSDDWITVDDALKKLEAIDERQVKIVELRYFTGLTIEETASALGIAPATVKREWNLAKAWLAREFSE